MCNIGAIWARGGVVGGARVGVSRVGGREGGRCPLDLEVMVSLNYRVLF